MEHDFSKNQSSCICKKQVLDEHAVTVTQLDSEASGVGCSAWVVGPIVASPVMHRGDVMGWVNGAGVQHYESL